MTVVIILSVLAFSAILCFVEIPKMLRNKYYNDLWCFSVLLILGVILAILKALKFPLSTPSDWIAYVFSPISELLKDALK